MAEFVTQKENTRRLAILIACVIVDSVALAVGIYAIKRAGDIQKKPDNPENIEKLTAQVHGQEEANLALLENLSNFPEHIGWRHYAIGTSDRFPTLFRRGTGGYSALDHEALKKFLSDWADELKKFEIGKYKRWDASGGGENLTLTRLFEELQQKENDYKTRIAALEGEIKKELQKEKDIVKKSEEDLATLRKEISGPVLPQQTAAGLIGEISKLSRELTQIQKSHKEELDQLEADAIAKQNEATLEKNQNLRKKTAYLSQKAELKQRIFAIHHHREEALERREPDGEILAVNEDLKLAFINLLHKDRLFEGTRFTAYSLERGGEKLDKGVVEVIQVREEVSSVCAIVSEKYSDWPLKAGDKIYNELYEGGRPRYIAFAGRFTGRLSNEEAARVIREFGDVYQEQVDRKTNYLIAAEGYEDHPNYKLGLEFGVKTMREQYLYDYLGVK